MQSAADNEEELFDVVDEHNRVTGQERRSVVHARGLKHRAVYCFVFNNKGELLLQQRSPQCARAAEGCLLQLLVRTKFQCKQACYCGVFCNVQEEDRATAVGPECCRAPTTWGGLQDGAFTSASSGLQRGCTPGMTTM